MNLIKYRPLIESGFLSAILYTAHKLIFIVFENHINTSHFHWQIEHLYSFFILCNLLLIFAMIQIKAKNIDQVGQAFLIGTCLQMALSYLLLRPILKAEGMNIRVEKIHFFSIFVLFLLIETIVTIRILNNKS